MKIKRLSADKRIGTCLQGYLDATVYTEEILARHFGDPFHTGGIYDKVTREWVLDIGGMIVTIYDYKGHKWHIGGRGSAAVVLVKTVLQATDKNCYPAR